MKKQKRRKETLKGHFKCKLQIPDVTHELCHLVFLVWLQYHFICSYKTVIL